MAVAKPARKKLRVVQMCGGVGALSGSLTSSIAPRSGTTLMRNDQLIVFVEEEVPPQAIEPEQVIQIQEEKLTPRVICESCGTPNPLEAMICSACKAPIEEEDIKNER
jgi:hypothetical protein